MYHQDFKHQYKEQLRNISRRFLKKINKRRINMTIYNERSEFYYNMIITVVTGFNFEKLLNGSSLICGQTILRMENLLC